MFLQNYYTLLEISRSKSIVGYQKPTSVSLIQYDGNTISYSYNIGGYNAYYYGIIYGTNLNFSTVDALKTTPPTAYSGTTTNQAQTSIQSSYNIILPYFSIVFGTGTTPPSLTDYTVENLISNIMFTGSYVGGDGNTKTFTYSYINNNDEEITINEVVIFGGIGGIGGYTYSGSYPTCATYREVLSTPITVAAGGTFDYVITVSYDGNS